MTATFPSSLFMSNEPHLTHLGRTIEVTVARSLE
jgi:hypothetical protein